LRGLFDEDERTRLSTSEPRAVKRTPRAHVLEVVSAPEGVSHERMLLNRNQLVLGRAADAQLQIESELLSRHHARFTRRHGEYHVLDLDSSNGVILNGLRVHSALLRDGDQLQLGDLVLLYREGA
jgi:predicted component of type VI protein secretion system